MHYTLSTFPSQTFGRIPQVDPPGSSRIYTRGVVESRAGSATFRISFLGVLDDSLHCDTALGEAG